MRKISNAYYRIVVFFLIFGGFAFTYTPLVRAVNCTGLPRIGSLPLTDCDLSVSSVTGVDQANNVESSTSNTAVLTVNTGTSITINSGGTLAFGSIVLNGGTVAIAASGAQLKPGTPLYVADTDADGFATDLTVSTATASGKRRLSLMRTTQAVDCGPDAFSVNNACVSTCWSIGGACDGGCMYAARNLQCGSYFVTGSQCSGTGSGACYKSDGTSALAGCDDSMNFQPGSCSDTGWGCTYLNTATTCTWMAPTSTPTPTPSGCWAISNVCDSGCVKASRYLQCGSYFTSGGACASGTGTCYKSSGASAILGCNDSIGFQPATCSDAGYGCTYSATATTCTWKP